MLLGAFPFTWQLLQLCACARCSLTHTHTHKYIDTDMNTANKGSRTRAAAEAEETEGRVWRLPTERVCRGVEEGEVRWQNFNEATQATQTYFFAPTSVSVSAKWVQCTRLRWQQEGGSRLAPSATTDSSREGEEGRRAREGARL